MSPSESFQEYFVDIDGIFFDTWVGIFCDMAMDERYFWMKKMIDK